MTMRKVINTLGWLTGIEAVLMVGPGANAYFEGDLPLAGTFFASALLTLFFASIAVAATAGASGSRIGSREQGALLLLIWPVLALMAAIPFYFSGYAQPANAVFEAISGITTTGATVLTQPELAPDAVLLWRALLQAYGGLISIVVVIVILADMRNGGMDLFVSGIPRRENHSITARLVNIALVLAPLYIGLMGIGAVLLWLAGMRGLDAFCYSAAALSTGGFSTHHLGPELYKSQFVEGILSLLMLFGAFNLTLIWAHLAGRRSPLRVDSEWRYFIGLFGVAAALLALMGYYDAIQDDRMHRVIDITFAAMFTAASFISTTAFVGSEHADILGPPAVMLVLLIVLGGCTGSTAGGVKIIRAVIMVKHTVRELARLSHPHGIVRMRMNSQRITDSVLNRIWSFCLVFIVTIALATWGLTLLTEYTAVTALATAVAILSNAGPAIAAISPDAAPIIAQPAVAKWFMCLMMVIGRVEILAFLLLMNPAFWRR